MLANDASALAATYERLIAAAPKAASTEVESLEANALRPGVYTLTMTYEQFDAQGATIHAGSAVYLMQRVDGALKLCGVF